MTGGQKVDASLSAGLGNCLLHGKQIQSHDAAFKTGQVAGAKHCNTRTTAVRLVAETAAVPVEEKDGN